jgi:hypothetical protein
MSVRAISCEQAEEADLHVRYASGALSPADAEAFELHFFGCDPCWTRVQSAIELRAAAAVGASAGGSSDAEQPGGPGSARMKTAASPRTQRRAAPRRWWGLAAAASIVVAIGVWSGRARLDSPGPDVAMRGGDTLHLVVSAREAELTAAWERVGTAARYRVRLYSGDGAVLFEREQTDTSIVLAEQVLPAGQRGAQVYWEVQALSRMRQPIARSGLLAARVATRPR